MTRSPVKQDAPVIEGPALPTIFVTECVGMGLSDDLITLTFSELRPTGSRPPKMEKRVVARLAMPTIAFDQMTEKAVGLARAAALNTAPSDPMKKN